jgi:riboflavin biosynthesis pyrimidine reductase
VLPADCRTADDVDALARALYGAVPLGDGVVHVTALWSPTSGPSLTLRINEHTPRSAHDFFALNLARARADAIIVTGKVLREEPTLRYDLQGAAGLPAALDAWRRERAGREQPPFVYVLTSGRGLDADHPVWSSWARPVVFTSGQAALSLPERVEVARVNEPSLRAAIAHARDRGARCVSVEAGPSTSRALYEDPALVDELLLSELLVDDIPEVARGDELVDRERLHELLPRASAPAGIEEPSGRWRFSRLLRGAG